MIEKMFLDAEFDKFWQKIENGENFAFIRNADGERMIATNSPIKAQEGGWESPGCTTKLGEDILKTFDIVDEEFFYAISCPCCDLSAYYWYMTRITNRKNTTFANLWINGNYPRFKGKFGALKRDAVLIANYSARDRAIGKLNILKHYEISDDCISFWIENAPEMLSAIKRDFGMQENLLYVVSAGPMSGPIIAELHKNNRNNCYMDFGSAIDAYYREKISRPYMKKDNIYAERNCWMYDPSMVDFNVSVVLNLYKRPQNLEIQLDAVINQTLKPKEVLLYQDGTGDTVSIPEDLKSKFNLIEINPKNIGVWGRFDFAMRKATCKYVCIFDDDTIPGSRWLENCHTEMIKQEGLYGTIGIVLEKPEMYPDVNKGSHFRVGWQGNLNHTVEVDFVGHSWFFKNEWLPCLFNTPAELREYKLVGEDMSFSYQLLTEKNIKTYVPPHYKRNKEFHGSLKKYANDFGNSKEAISVNTTNVGMMKEAMSFLMKQGWNILARRDKAYLKKIKGEARWQNGPLVDFFNRCMMFVKKGIQKYL